MAPEEMFKNQVTILVIDDTPENLALISDMLKDTYKIKVANNGEKALKIAQSEKPPDLILLDIMMPEMDGYEVCRRLKNERKTSDIPVIFLTAKSEEADEKYGLELGAVDYVTKPVSIPILLARIKTHLNLKAASDFLKDKNEFLENEISVRTREIRAIQDVTIMALASLAETRDNETGNHIRRTQIYIKLLAEKLKDNQRFSNFVSDFYIDMLYKSAPLHDIGKVGIPDHILLKPDKLTEEEFEIMKTHTTIGKQAILNAEKELGSEVEFLKFAKEIAYSHHEKWDGSGYPQGLSGDDIPFSARLMALADVYDALISKRVYKPPMTHEQAVEIIMKGKGIHFDPGIADVFFEINEEFRGIVEKFKEH